MVRTGWGLEVRVWNGIGSEHGVRFSGTDTGSSFELEASTTELEHQYRLEHRA